MPTILCLVEKLPRLLHPGAPLALAPGSETLNVQTGLMGDKVDRPPETLSPTRMG